MSQQPLEKSDLLWEIGCEELPASFVAAALEALPDLAAKELSRQRLGHGTVRALGTPRRLALLVAELTLRQADVEEEAIGPPVRVAFADGEPTKAAIAFAKKLGCAVSELRRVETPKGEYVAGVRREQGKATAELLPAVLEAITRAIPFRKSMRWGSGDFAFGRPIRWLVALLGQSVIPLELAGVTSGRQSRGHRFLHPEPVPIERPATYVEALRGARVIVDPAERRQLMQERLATAAAAAGCSLIEDSFLVAENLSLVEEPQVIAGSFDEEFLRLPERVILEVAKGHQRYFGLRHNGQLAARYLAVVNTAEDPASIRQGNDRVMRARLADARFFYDEDLKCKLADRRSELDGIVFQNRLGTVAAKVARIERLTRLLGQALGAAPAVVDSAVAGAALCKNDLVTLMVGEFPELQGEVGRAYAEQEGIEAAVAEVIRDHYAPAGAKEPTAPSPAAALVAMADRLDTLVGCFAIGLSPTGTADPYGLRRACIGTLRTLLDHELDLELSPAFRRAYEGYTGDHELDLSVEELCEKLGAFFRDRLRGLLGDSLAHDAVEAALGVAADRPLDARARALAILELSPQVRGQVGEVFKRAANIAKEAPTAGDPEPPAAVVAEVHASEKALFDGYLELRAQLGELRDAGDYQGAFSRIAGFAPVLGQYFDDVLVMTEDEAVRHNRLRLMRSIADLCGTLAKLELLGSR